MLGLYMQMKQAEVTWTIQSQAPHMHQSIDSDSLDLDNL